MLEDRQTFISLCMKLKHTQPKMKNPYLDLTLIEYVPILDQSLVTHSNIILVDLKLYKYRYLETQ